MTSFSQFLTEANAIGSKFEQKIASNVNSWIKENGLQSKFKASRFQKISEAELVPEADGSRDEDYSDVVVDDLENGDQFFIECKKSIKDNIITTQFDVAEDFTLHPVQNVQRDAVDDDITLKLAYDLQNTSGFKKFASFLQERPDVLEWRTAPADFFFNRVDVDDKTLHMLMKMYNKIVKSGNTEADCKTFDMSLVREATRNMLAVALLWRLDTSNTWDICCADDLAYFGDLVRKHYLEDKEVPAKYLQLGDELFMSREGDNPLELGCPVLPSQITGKFYLKFTPRFGTGSMYITPRSSITDTLESSCSFKTRSKWPRRTNAK